MARDKSITGMTDGRDFSSESGRDALQNVSHCFLSRLSYRNNNLPSNEAATTSVSTTAISIHKSWTSPYRRPFILILPLISAEFNCRHVASNETGPF